MILTPYVRFAMRHTWFDNNYINRSIWDHEIIFIEHGSLKLTINDEVYIAKANDCIILRPNINHILDWNGEVCIQPHVHFDFYHQPDSEKVGISFIPTEKMTDEEKTYFRNDFYKENQIDIPHIIHLTNPMEIRILLYRIIDEFTYKKSYSEYILQGLMTELIGKILQENSKTFSKNEDTHEMDNLINYMLVNVEKNLSLAELSSKMNVSKWTLIEMFNQKFHCSPIKYYNKIKYSRAKELILYTFLSISEISNKMNFADLQTFSRWFKKMDGEYPSTYRKNRNK